MNAQQRKLELNLHVTYKLKGASLAALSNALVEAAEHLADNGLLTGDTPAKVVECTHEVLILRSTSCAHAHDLRLACLRLLQAAEGLDALNDDESRAEAYADELRALDEAKDAARDALALGIPPNEAARRAPLSVPGTPATSS